jgi:single-stranded DNA-binding protein
MTTEAINLAVLWGECPAPPEVRQLPSGQRVANLSIRVRPDDGRADSVPVTVWEPPVWLEDVDEGEEVFVVGRVRRRFYRNPVSGTASRTDVEAAVIARRPDARRREALRRRVHQMLEPLE